MKISVAVGVLALTLTSAPAFAQSAGGAASPVDRKFVGEASASNTFEIQSSRMALQKSRNPAVRGLARWMIEDHAMAERKLQAAATYEDYQGGASPVVTPDTSAMLDDLSKLDGAAFDKAYVADQVAAHELTAQTLSDYRAAGSYDPLLAWDAQTAPHVDDHLAHFRALAGTM